MAITFLLDIFLLPYQLTVLKGLLNITEVFHSVLFTVKLISAKYIKFYEYLIISTRSFSAEEYKSFHLFLLFRETLKFINSADHAPALFI